MLWCLLSSPFLEQTQWIEIPPEAQGNTIILRVRQSLGQWILESWTYLKFINFFKIKKFVLSKTKLDQKDLAWESISSIKCHAHVFCVHMCFSVRGLTHSFLHVCKASLRISHSPAGLPQDGAGMLPGLPVKTHHSSSLWTATSSGGLWASKRCRRKAAPIDRLNGSITHFAAEAVK